MTTTLYGTGGIIDTKVNQVAALIAVAQAGLAGFLPALASNAELEPDYITPSTNSFTVADVKLDESDLPNFDQMDGDISNIEAEVNSISSDPANIDPINDPTEVTMGNWLAEIPRMGNLSEGEYASALSDALNERVLDALQNGGTGLSASVEADIQNREAERNAQAFLDARDKLASTWAKDGWMIPDNVLTAQMADLAKKEVDRNTDRSREIRVQSFTMADANKQFFHNLAVTYESKMMDVFSQKQERALNYFMGKAQTAALIFKSYIDAVKTEAEIAVDNTKNQLETEKIRTDRKLAKFNELSKRADMQIALLDSVGKQYGMKADVYRAKVGFKEAQAHINVELQRDSARIFLQQFQSEIEGKRHNLDSYLAAAQIKNTAGQAGATIFANFMAAAFNAISFGVNVSDSNSTGTSTNVVLNTPSTQN